MKRKRPLTPEEFKAIYSKVPRFCVEVVINTPKGVILTLRAKNGYEGAWHLPGGTVFYKESVEDAVARVAMEELGVDVIIERLLGYINYFSEESERGYGYTVSLAFLCSTDAKKFKLDDDAEKIGFFKKVPENTIIEQKEFLEKLDL